MWQFNAGDQWNPVLKLHCMKYNLKHIYETTSHIDLLLDSKIAVEFKAEDLHSSLFMKYQIAGNLRWEMQQYYLPLRAQGQIEEIWIYVALTETTSWKDIEALLSYAFDHRIAVKLFESREAAVKDCATQWANYGKPIDLHYPPYINMSLPIPMITKMMRIFPGMTEERIQEYMDRYAQSFIETEDPEPIIPEEFFEWFTDQCKANSNNLERLWYDFWCGGMEPKENTITFK